MTITHSPAVSGRTTSATSPCGTSERCERPAGHPSCCSDCTQAEPCAHCDRGCDPTDAATAAGVGRRDTGAT